MQPESPPPARARRADRRARGSALFYIEALIFGVITVVGVVMSLGSAARAILSAMGW